MMWGDGSALLSLKFSAYGAQRSEPGILRSAGNQGALASLECLKAACSNFGIQVGAADGQAPAGAAYGICEWLAVERHLDIRGHLHFPSVRGH